MNDILDINNGLLVMIRVLTSICRFTRALTARGKEIPQQQVSVKTLASKLKVLRRIEQYISELWFSMIGPMDGGLGPISADDFADWPR